MATLTIQELPAEDRPREKLLKFGAQSLSESELIAIILRTGVQGANAVDVARQLLKEYNSLRGLQRCTVKQLAKIKGVGMTKGGQLAAAFELATRMARETLFSQKIDSPQLTYDLLGAEMQALTYETLKVILLDTKYHFMRTETVSTGGLNESVAHPREVFKPAIMYSAFAMIAVHNHPSGDPAPSEADHRITRRLAEAAALLQIQLLDHVIIGSSDNGRRPYFSFREAGIL